MFFPFYVGIIADMKKIAMLLCVFLAFPLLANAEEAIMWTSDGYRMGYANAEGHVLTMTDARETENGVTINIGVLFTLFHKDGGTVWEATHIGDGTGHLDQAIPLESGGWLAAGSCASPDLADDWHEGWYDGKERKSDAWLIMLDADGQTVWSRCYGGTDWDSFTSVCPSREGGWIAVGHTYSEDGDVDGWHDSGELFRQPDGWVVSLDEEGNIRWQHPIGGGDYDELFGIRQVPGGYMAIGTTASMDGDVSGGHGDWDGWVVLISEEGEILRQACYGTEEEDQLIAMAEGEDGWVAIGTTWVKSADGQKNENRAWAIMLDGEGNMVHEIMFGTDELQKAKRVAWNVDFWAVAGVTFGESSEREWIAGIRRDFGEWKTVRGKL